MTMKYKKLVAVTPAKNEEVHILKCINSVLKQTYPIVLHLIVDDCSEDRTREIVENIKDERVKLISSGLKRGEKQRGLRPHLVQQIGINEATKLVPDWKYLLLLDGDCWIPSYYCERMIKEFGEDDRLAMVGARYLKTPSKIEKSTLTHVRSSNHIIRREFYEECLKAGRNYATPHGEIVLERHAWINGWKTKTIPTVAYSGRETGVTVPSAFQKGVHYYQLGTPLWLLILVFITHPCKEKLLNIFGWLYAQLKSKPRFFTSEEIEVLNKIYKKRIAVKILRINIFKLCYSILERGYRKVFRY